MQAHTRLNAILKARYDLDLMVEPISYDHIETVYEHYRAQYELGRDGNLMETADTSKAYLISEAARMILREIAPKRRKKTKGA